jgi:hypothetical protein
MCVSYIHIPLLLECILGTHTCPCWFCDDVVHLRDLDHLDACGAFLHDRVQRRHGHDAVFCQSAFFRGGINKFFAVGRRRV